MQSYFISREIPIFCTSSPCEVDSEPESSVSISLDSAGSGGGW